MLEILKEFVVEFAVRLAAVFLPILASMLTAFLIAKVKEAWAAAKYQAGNWSWVLDSIAITAVQAAEQVALVDKAIDKKDYAVSVAQEFLNAKGYKIDLELIDAAIEAAVMEQFNQNKPTE